MAVDENEALVLDQWTHRLAQALQILDLDVDQELLLDLARKSADSVIHAAAPVTTFLVGYAAGLDAGRHTGAGSADAKESSAAAVATAADVASRLCDDGHDGGPAATGWADTGQ